MVNGGAATPWVCAGILYAFPRGWAQRMGCFHHSLVHWDYFKNVALSLARPPPLIRGLLAAPGTE